MSIQIINKITENVISFDVEKREALRSAYEAACEEGVDEFEFDGNEYVTSYAKYLLEYLDMKLQSVH